MNRKDHGKWAGRAAGCRGRDCLGCRCAPTMPATGARRLSSVMAGADCQGNQVLADPAIENTPLFEGTRWHGDDGPELQLKRQPGAAFA